MASELATRLPPTEFWSVPSRRALEERFRAMVDGLNERRFHDCYFLLDPVFRLSREEAPAGPYREDIDYRALTDPTARAPHPMSDEPISPQMLLNHYYFYLDDLRRYMDRYGSISLFAHELHGIWLPKKEPEAPIAAIHLSWFDAASALHSGRERWILRDGTWYTRVMGYVTPPRDW